MKKGTYVLIVAGLLAIVAGLLVLGNWMSDRSATQTQTTAQSQTGQTDISSKELKIRATRLALAEAKQKANKALGQGDWRKADKYARNVASCEKQLERLSQP